MDHFNAYQNEEKAIRYHQKRGFDPVRKQCMLEVCQDILTEITPKDATLLELGAGSGLFTKMIAERKHFSHIYVTDGSAKMLEIAKKELSMIPFSVHYDRLNFTQSNWSQHYEDHSIHAVTSSMAIHHATDKRRVFQEVWNVLDTHGLFVLADHMAGSTDAVDRFIKAKRAKVRYASQGNHRPTFEEIDQFITQDTQKQAAEGNKCESISDYMQYLREVGFADVDCIWRDYGWRCS